MEVINANDESFKDILLNQDKIIIKFYASWCGSCRLIAPKFKALATKEAYKDITFVKVDAENNPQLRALAKVNNLPFFATFKDKKLIDATTSSKIDEVEKLVEKL